MWESQLKPHRVRTCTGWSTQCSARDIAVAAHRRRPGLARPRLGRVLWAAARPETAFCGPIIMPMWTTTAASVCTDRGSALQGSQVPSEGTGAGGLHRQERCIEHAAPLCLFTELCLTHQHATVDTRVPPPPVWIISMRETQLTKTGIFSPNRVCLFGRPADLRARAPARRSRCDLANRCEDMKWCGDAN